MLITRQISILLKTEEAMMFLLGWYLFGQLGFEWWWFWALLLLPDIGMLGYIRGPVWGARLYNLFHHKGLAVGLYLLGMYLSLPLCQLVGCILFSHASLDRVFGYGLKLTDGFAFTHLGKIGTDLK